MPKPKEEKEEAKKVLKERADIVKEITDFKKENLRII